MYLWGMDPSKILRPGNGPTRSPSQYAPPTWPKAIRLLSTSGYYLSNEVLVLLYEVIQIVLVLIDVLQEVGSLELQPVQLLIHLAGGSAMAGGRLKGGWEGDSAGLMKSQDGLACGCSR